MLHGTGGSAAGRRLGLACLLFAAGLGAGAEQAEAPRAPSPAERFDAAVESFFEGSLRLNPLLATRLGDRRYDHLLGDLLSPASREQARRLATETLQVLATVDESALDPERRLTARVLAREARDTLVELDLPDRFLPVHHTLGSLPVDLALLAREGSIQPFETVADYERFLARILAFPAWVERAIATMRQGIEAGVVLPCSVVDATLPVLEAHASATGNGNVFYGPVMRLPEDVPRDDRGRIAAAYLRAIRDEVAPAYSRLHAFLAKEYRPSCRPGIAYSELPGGEAGYRYLVRSYTSTTLSPEVVFKVGLAEVDRLVGEVAGLIKEAGYEASPSTFYAALRGPRQLVRDLDALLAGYRAVGDGLRAKLPELFGRLPGTPLEVRALGTAGGRSQPGAFYQPGPLDRSRPGVFWVNADGGPFTSHGMKALYYHEALPGHHLQIALAQELEGLPRFRRALFETAFSEGWALYAEGLAEESGLYTTVWERYGRLEMELLRSARLVGDVAIHHLKWSREEVEKVLRARALGYGVREIDRYVVWPGQALAYKIGELRIETLRRRAEQALGESFDLRALHDELLGHGALPLDILEEVIDAWIAARVPRPPGGEG